MNKKTVENWVEWLQDARRVMLNGAVDVLNFAEFIVAQQARIDELERAVKDGQAQANTWRLLAAERLELIKKGEKQNG